MKSLTQIADQIAVCPVPGGGHRFNGLLSLSEAANRIEPLLADLADRKSTRLNSSHFVPSRMPSSA